MTVSEKDNRCWCCDICCQELAGNGYPADNLLAEHKRAIENIFRGLQVIGFGPEAGGMLTNILEHEDLLTPLNEKDNEDLWQYHWQIIKEAREAMEDD